MAWRSVSRPIANASAPQSRIPRCCARAANASVRQSERLNQAITRYHAEGIRFAAFTLIRMLDNAGPELRQDTRAALQRLKDASEASGLPH